MPNNELKKRRGCLIPLAIFAVVLIAIIGGIAAGVSGTAGQKPKSLLAETSLKIHEISYEAGYENVNHFIAHLKKNTGMTPTEYRLIPR